jgi:hypothetical protein
MPVSHAISTRETIDLHAPWWSPKRTQDGTLTTPEVGPDDEGRYVERCVIYAQLFHIDEEWAQGKSLGKFDMKKKAMDPMQAAKAPRFLLQRMVQEITDPTGHPLPKTATGDHGEAIYSEAFFAGMFSQDTTWISEQINALKEPPVPVIDADVAVAEKREERYLHLVGQGYGDDHPLVTRIGARDAEVVAQERFPGDGASDLYE